MDLSKKQSKNKKFKIKVSTVVELKFLGSYNKESLEFLLNESSHCAGNEIDHLAALYKKLRKRGWCPCMSVEFEVLEDA